MAREIATHRIGHLDRFFQRPMMREAFARLLANLGLGGPATQCSIGLTAATPGEGVTTLSLYLGAEIVRTFGVPTLVIETNFRRPRLADYTGVDPTPGLLDVLQAEGLKMDVKIRKSRLSNLFLVPAGGIHPHPLGLLTSERFLHLLDGAEERYSVVIVDTPPVLRYAEAPPVLKTLDRALLVVEDTCREEAVKQAVRVLEEHEVTLAGTVLNRKR